MFKRKSQSSVLMYHRVAPRSPSDHAGLTVSPDSFRAQMKWLVEHDYHTPSSDEWLRSISEEGCGKRLVLLTFDDAYADIVEFALPVLQEYGLNAIIFVVTGLIGLTNLWEDPANSSRYKLMNAEQIRRWSERGFEFAPHSRTHADLRALSASKLGHEIAGSWQDLRGILEKPVPTFAYPFGYYNDAVIASVRQSFLFAFTTDNGLNNPITDPYLLRRTMVLPDDSLFDFSLRVKRGRSIVNSVRATLRPVKRFFFSGTAD